MKLYIWADPYPVSYGTSMLLAVADGLEQAKELAKSSAERYTYVQYRENVAPGLPIELGEPTRIVELPCAEWHEWQE